jgi:signal transduction histidine kinase
MSAPEQLAHLHPSLRLRGRLAITGLALALPAMAAVVWGRHQYQWRSAQGTLLEVARARVAEGGRAICDGQVREWPPAPGEMSLRHAGGGATFGRLIAYDRDGRPLDGDGPPLVPELAAAAREGRDGIVAMGDFGGRPVVQALLRAPWSDAKCTYLAFVRPRPAELPHDPWPVAPLGGAFVVVGLFLAALGPVVRRIRRLTLGVRRSAAGAYLVPVAVEGHDEIAELATAFNGAAAEVRAQVEAQEHREQVLRNFLANTTHDVAIPLTVLQGRLAAMRRAQQAGAAVEGDLVTHAIEDAHHLGALIHNLGAAAKLEAGEPEISRLPVDLSGVVRRCVARHQPLAELLGVDLQAALPEHALHATGDVTLLEEAVGNVVYNAIHYNTRGGHVAVVLDPLAAGRFSITIADDGPGLAPGEAEHLFERAFRGDAARSRKPQGRGLGLDIAKRVADVHRMTLTPESPAEGGLRMVFEGAIVEPTSSAAEPA